MLHAHSASLDYMQSVVHVLGDLESRVDMGGFGKGFHEGIVLFLAVDDLEKFTSSSLDTRSEVSAGGVG